MFADQHLEMGEGSLYVGVIGVRIVKYDVLRLVREEKVEKKCKDESEYHSPRDKNDHKFLIPIFLLPLLPLLLHTLRVLGVMLIHKDLEMRFRHRFV